MCQIDEWSKIQVKWMSHGWRSWDHRIPRVWNVWNAADQPFRIMCGLDTHDLPYSHSRPYHYIYSIAHRLIDPMIPLDVGIAIINHKPFLKITIFMGGINHQKWVAHGIAIPIGVMVTNWTWFRPCAPPDAPRSNVAWSFQASQASAGHPDGMGLTFSRLAKAKSRRFRLGVWPREKGRVPWALWQSVAMALLVLDYIKICEYGISSDRYPANG